MQKVSMWAAAKKTFLLMKARAKYFGLYLLAFLGVSILPILGISDFTSANAAPEISLWGLFVVVVSLVISISLQHFIIGSCRNKTSFFTSTPFKTFFSYIFVITGMMVVALVGGGVFLAFSTGYSALGILDDPNNQTTGLLLLSALGLPLALVLFSCMLRLSFTFPAVAIGDTWSFFKSWKMTKGHSIRLILSVVTISIIPLVIGWAIMAGFAVLFPDSFAASAILFISASVIVQCLQLIFTVVFYSVVYNDLHERFEAMNDGGEFALENPNPIVATGQEK